MVILEINLANNCEYTLKDIYGEEKALDNGGIQFKVESMTLNFYNKPKKDNKTKILIQGGNKEAILSQPNHNLNLTQLQPELG